VDPCCNLTVEEDAVVIAIATSTILLRAGEASARVMRQMSKLHITNGTRAKSTSKLKIFASGPTSKRLQKQIERSKNRQSVCEYWILMFPAAVD
jgi:hypothetical protein